MKLNFLLLTLIYSYMNEMKMNSANVTTGNPNTYVQSTRNKIFEAHTVKDSLNLQVVKPIHSTSMVKAIIDLILYWKWNNPVWVLDDNSSGVTYWDIVYLSTTNNINITIKIVNFPAFCMDDHYFSGYIVSVKSYNLMNIMKWMVSNYYILAKTSWIIFNDRWPSNEFPSILQKSLKIQLTIIAAIVLFHDPFKNHSIPKFRRGNDVKFIFLDVFYSSTTGNIEQVTFATWNRSEGLQFLQSLYSQLRFRPWFTISSHHPPQVIVPNIGSLITGHLVDLFESISEDLQMRLYIDTTKNFVYVSNQSEHGMFRNLSTREYDVIMFSVGMSSSRKQMISFLPSVGASAMAIMIRSPQNGPNYTLYLHPFNFNVWMTMFVLFCVTIILLSISQSNFHQNPNSNHNGKWLFWILTGSCITDAFFNESRGLASRIFVHTIMLTAYITFCCYSSVLTSFLTVNEESLPFRDIYELAENEEYFITAVIGTTYEEYFRNSREGSPYYVIWQNAMQKDSGRGLVLNLPQALDKTYYSKYALLCTNNPSNLAYIEGRTYMFIPNIKLFEELDYIGIRTDFPYIKVISNLILKMKENGQLDRFKKKYSTGLHPSPERKITLALQNVMSPFLLLLSGIVLSFTAICIEMSIYENE